MENRPVGRKKNITGEGKEIRRQGSGLGTGPVGRPNIYSPGPTGGRTRSTGTGYSSYGHTTRSSGGKGIIAVVIGIIVLILGGGGFGLSSMFGDSDSGGYTSDTGWNFATETSSSGWTGTSNNGKLNTSAVDGARDKYTILTGGGRDTVTVMVYMCGTDLETKGGMASSDLAEMTKASISDKVNVIVYTGGCSEWKNDFVSNSVNQIYKVESGGLRCLVKNDGKDPMTNPSTLTRFIKYAAENYPATRKILIMWDHGGGSITGFGYDEKNTSAGAMSLSGINRALSNAGEKFDFIGFDACLMATYENALMLEPYADYLIASEETEPGIGWYYTDWLNHLSKNSSYSTVELGKQIADDFVKTCNSRCPGQSATLSVVDLAELAAATPDAFNAFAVEATELCSGNDYQRVSDARAGARSYALSSKKDMVDLAHLGYKIGTAKAKALADAVVSAVKYNCVSTNMANSYGLSIYFPYQKIATVDSAVSEYEKIGIDDDYAKCIRSFASLELAGQQTSSSSPLGSLFGSFSGQSPVSYDGVSSIFSSLLSGNAGSGLSGLTSFFGKDIDVDRSVGYIANHQLDSSSLVWKQSGSRYLMQLTEAQWSLVQDLELNVFYDDGEGYIDLGFDNVFDFTKDGDLIGEYDGSWIAIDSQPVPYYHESTVTVSGETIISGYVPILLNGERAELLIVFDDKNPNGYVTGARRVYKDGETDTVAKSHSELTTGDKIEFICDYYTYGGEYEDSYVIADMVFSGNLGVSNVYINAEHAVATYVFTDIYGQYHWSEKIPK
ncbi:MAG: peptidase C11 [Clostridia bacterium]|nr:peptidase C11 [Clostridia bacterium]